MSDKITEHQKQLEREIKETNKQIRMMIKVCIYTSFTVILITIINVIIRGFEYGFT